MASPRVDMSKPLLLEVAPEIDTDPTSFYRGGGSDRGRHTVTRCKFKYKNINVIKINFCLPGTFWNQQTVVVVQCKVFAFGNVHVALSFLQTVRSA